MCPIEKGVNFAQEFLDDPRRNDNVELTLYIVITYEGEMPRILMEEAWMPCEPSLLASPAPIINSTYKASTCLYPPLSWGWRKAPLDRKSPWSVGKEPSVLAAAAPTLTLSAPAVLLSLAHRRTQAASQDTWVLARLCAYLIFSLFFLIGG